MAGMQMSSKSQPPSEETPAGEAQGPPEGSEPGEGGPQGQVSQLLQGVHDGLLLTAKLLDQNPGANDDDKQELGQIISQFEDFIKNMTADQSEGEPGAVPMDGGQATMEQGASNSKPYSPAG